MREIADCATLCTQHMVVSRSQTIFFFTRTHVRGKKRVWSSYIGLLVLIDLRSTVVNISSALCALISMAACSLFSNQARSGCTVLPPVQQGVSFALK